MAWTMTVFGFFPDALPQREAYMSIAFLMPDQSLGEFDVQTRVGKVKVTVISQATSQARPLQTLPASSDSLYRPH
jgi:hypothetical protein